MNEVVLKNASFGDIFASAYEGCVYLSRDSDCVSSEHCHVSIFYTHAWQVC